MCTNGKEGMGIIRWGWWVDMKHSVRYLSSHDKMLYLYIAAHTVIEDPT